MNVDSPAPATTLLRHHVSATPRESRQRDPDEATNAGSTPHAAPPWPAWRAILVGGLGAGSADLAYVFAFHGARGVAPERILQSIASGVLGMSAFDGGWPSAALGAALHFSILLAVAAMFLVASRRLSWIGGIPRFAAGIACGLAIYGVMHAIVLPLSAAPAFKAAPLAAISDFAMHLCVIGPIIAFATRRGA